MPTTVADQYLTIEKTPHYFIDRATPLRIAQFFPQIKLIVLLRDPIVRAISDYVQLNDHRRSYPSFDQIVAEWNFTQWTPIRIGCYARYLRQWLKLFSLGQIHFVDGENLIRRPWEELRRVQTFLNISMELGQEDFYFNASKPGFPCLRQPNGCLGSAKGRAHPPISTRTREKLKQFYSKCNAQLKHLAHIDFPWIQE